MQLRFRSKINDNAKFEQAFQREFEAKVAPRWFRVLSGLVLLVGLGAIGYALLPDAVRLIALFLSAGAFVWLWSIGYGYWYRYFHSRYLHDSEDADICIVEVSDGRFTTEVRGYRTSFLLSSLSMAYEREDFVYLYFGRLGAARLPFSAFESDAQRSAFIALVESEKKEPNQAAQTRSLTRPV